MLDLLSPLRGYLAQTLQFYLSKYLEDIQLEGLGLFGGDLVLNDLEIKRHVLRESLEIPSSFDFSRGFIRELRIHIPWTQLLSQPIEVKLYTIELILAARSERATPRAAKAAEPEQAEDRIEQPKSGWVHDTLQRILANVSVQVNNLVLNDGDAKEGATHDRVRRKVVGYELPVLSRTSASVRAKLQLFPNVAVRSQDGRKSKPSSPRSPLHHLPSTLNGVQDEGNVIDVDGLFGYRPSVMCDPFYSYSCNRSSVAPTYEVDVYIGELLFSVSDRQLEMLNQLIKSASKKIDQAHYASQEIRASGTSGRTTHDTKIIPVRATSTPDPISRNNRSEDQKADGTTKKRESWFGWAMSALGTTEDEQEDELVSELLAETRGALLKGQPPESNVDDEWVGEPPTKTSCVRLCISSASLTLRKHDKIEQESEQQDSAVVENEEELVPVANIGMVKVSRQTKKKRVARPAMPVLNLMMSYVALEMLLARSDEQNGTDFVFEIEKVELVSATSSENREDSKCKKEQTLLTWGTIDSSHFSDCVSHPYFINSFFEEETTRLNQRETRSFEIVKVSLDADIPVWKTLKANNSQADADEKADASCECFTTWDGKNVRCIPISAVSDICHQALKIIGIKERVLDGGILSNAVSTAWASKNLPVSISEGMLRALTSIAEEYRVHRNPDLGAQDNLALLLQPQLHALFCRYTMHSCQAASARKSTMISNIRHRSAHSALRLRLAITSSRADDAELPAKKESISKVLDISFGGVQAILEPSKCVEILEAVLTLLRSDDKQETGNEVSTATTEALPGAQFIVESDVKLFTMTSVCIHLPRKSWNDETDTNLGCVHLIGRDIVWLGTFYPGDSKSRLKVGDVSAQLEEAEDQPDHSKRSRLMEVLGFELLLTSSCAGGGDNDGLALSLDKLMVNFGASEINNVVDVVGGVVSPLGYTIPWIATRLVSKNADSVFQVEVCGAAFSKNVSNRPRLEMAQQQSLSTEIISISASVRKTTKRNNVTHCIFQGGAAPIPSRGGETCAPVFKCDIRQEKASGILKDVPLLGALPIFSLNPDSLSTTCSQCAFVINVKLTPVYVELKGVLNLVAMVQNLVENITEILPSGKHSRPPNISGQIVNSTSTTPTSWNVTLHLHTAGGEINVNEAFELSIPSVSLSSSETDTKPANLMRPGGTLKLQCSMGSSRLGVSKTGVLQGLTDPIIFGIESVRATVDLSHQYGDHDLAYAVDASLHVSNIQASLSRLKVKNSLSPHIRWHLRLGAQLDHAEARLTSDIIHKTDGDHRSIRAVVLGEVSNICVATRTGNHHPTKSHIPASELYTYTDIQASVGDIQVVERLQPTRLKGGSRFGEFSRLPEHAFLGILVCLGLADLVHLSKSLHVSSTNTPDSESLPSAMLSWQLTSNIAKAFQVASTEQFVGERHRTASVEIPLIVSRNDPELVKPTHMYPLLSTFYRNYNESGLPHHVIAGSMESVDIALTTSSLYCLASVLRVDSTDIPSFTRDDPAIVPRPRDSNSSPHVSLADIELSLMLGQVRIILPSEKLMDSILSGDSVVTGNVLIVLETLSMASAVRNDISLDGLGYPPFNSRVLPRRSTVQAQRFGQSQLRLGCRAGKISGHTADLGLSRSGSREHNSFGPFEERIGRTSGCAAQFTVMKTFWCPFNVACSVEEEPLSASGSDNPVLKTSTAIAITKLRFDLHKEIFDLLIGNIVRISSGLGALARSVSRPVQLKPVELTRPQKLPAIQGRLHQRDVEFSCDGIEVNMFETNTSTHVRIGSIIVMHNISLLSGSASIQNVVVGHRANEGPQSLAQKTDLSEEVIFGANTEPSLWHLVVENYPEKLVAARWNFGESTEGTLFIDVQAFQFHISHHFIMTLSQYVQSDSQLEFSTGYPKKQSKARTTHLLVRQPFVFQQRWNIKLLVAPSLMSYWRRNLITRGTSGILITSGQIFASAGLGSDEMALQTLQSCGQVVNEMNRFVAVPTLEVMLNIDKFGINTSCDLPPLQVNFRRSSLGPTSAHTGSTWQRFLKYINIASEAQRLVHDCSVRVTGDLQQMLERVEPGEKEVFLLHTELTRTNIQAEVNSLCVKLSSLSLAVAQTLLVARDDADSRTNTLAHAKVPANSQVRAIPKTVVKKMDDSETNDFKSLRRMAEGRRPSPGELVFTEALLIETQNSMSSDARSPITGTKAFIKIEPNSYDIELNDVASFLDKCNCPWGLEERELNMERSTLPGLGNKTHSWMGMRWCYHIPRSIYKIVASPVPVPPTGVPNGWPSWSWEQDQESDANRLCDILCQLRCWDGKKGDYVLVCEFYVPWERPLAGEGLDTVEDAYEPGSFGELVSQWFDDDMEQTRYRAKLLDFGSRFRIFSFDSPPSSDNWELRWRSPLQSELEPENKQKRLVVNALLASSLQVNSILDRDAYHRVVASVTLPQVTLSVMHVGATHYSHDVITAELSDTALSCAVSGSTGHAKVLSVRASSAIQVYLDNMAQLLTVSVIPRTTVDAMIESSSKGLEISTLIGPVSVYLNQTSMLVLSTLPKLLQPAPKLHDAHPDDNFSGMRIKLVNLTDGDIWYRQEGTSENLLLGAHTTAAYSWLSLANSPFYQLRFAVEDPNQNSRRNYDQVMQNDDACWCDPCRIKENVVTGRYFDGRGFLWVCVELKGLQTVVTLRSPLIFSNFCDFPVKVRVNGEKTEYECPRSEDFYQDTCSQKSGTSHTNCISLDGSSCTLSEARNVSTSSSSIMVESVSTLNFGIDGGPWCSMTPQDNIPDEFDHVRISDSQPDGCKKSHHCFIELHPEPKEQVFDFVECRVIVTTRNDHHPTVRVRTERVLSVANLTPSALHINFGSHVGKQRAVEQVAPCEERSIGFSVVSNRLVVSISESEASCETKSQIEWSPEISLNVNGDTKSIVVPTGDKRLRDLASTYCIELGNVNGYLKLTIRPQVVVINSTLLSGDGAGWSVPVCLHKEVKKRSITADVSSWLSSKISRRPSDESNSAKQALVARLSCSFRVSLVEDGYQWTEEIAVLLPRIPLLLDSDGKLKIVEPLSSSTDPPQTPESVLYPAPSTTTHRRRLLIPHRTFRHKMLTYTMTQKQKCIHIMFFVDHQPPVIIHNQWEKVLGFRNVSFLSNPEGVGSNFYLEYDWNLQQPTLTEDSAGGDNSDSDGSQPFRDWLEASMQFRESSAILNSANGERMRFQIGSPQFGWSNVLWQVGGIQFASFSDERESGNSGPTFLVMCFYRAGSWLISITCLEDPTHDGPSSGAPSMVLPSTTTASKSQPAVPAFLKVGVIVEEISLHFCDEHDPVRDARGMVLYPEILRATCKAVSVVFTTAPDPPEASRHSTRLGYMSHIRSYTTLFVAVEDIEVGHFLQTCNFPVILCFPETHASKDLLQFDRAKKQETLVSLMNTLLDKQLPGAEGLSFITRVIYTDTWDPVGIPSYFHSIELKLAPAVLQVEDDILTYVNAFIRPTLDALEGEAASSGTVLNEGCQTPGVSDGDWSMAVLKSTLITKQRKVYIDRLEISSLDVTITARVSIPVLNSFDGTPLHFGSTELREVFSFPDQLYKDLAADYVADTIVRSPMLLMSLNIIGNPAGFLRSFGQGVRDLIEIPLAASRNGYSPWVLTKGVVGGVASFLGHTTAATLTSVSGFSYSISRTMDQLTLSSDQLMKRHYTRPTQFSSALADGLGSLGSSVVGAATGVITTPIAVYKERQMQGLDTGLRSVVGGVGMGLVGIVARPMGGVASLVSMTSDGLLSGMGGNRIAFDDSVSRFDARPNELLRYKLKVLPDAVGSTLIFAHGIWVVSSGNELVASDRELQYISEEHLQAPENEPLRGLLVSEDEELQLVQVTVVSSNECLYVVGASGTQNQALLVQTSLGSIQAVEESLKEPTIFDVDSDENIEVVRPTPVAVFERVDR
ncbi:unnamed protein product [Phytophthora fragariaefolia]|uniref:Unnamed protein product n=1 Tax=Phytophthora fragariaefolia TaxID=1490495 RepID=A0A9W6WSV6_9STRA|nr:unnamed protein product [Phytophthora fragariaefolia]